MCGKKIIHVRPPHKKANGWLTWVGSHRYVRGVIFSRREVTGVLHRAVARGSDPRGGSVHQGAPLRQEVRRSSEIPSFHSEECWVIRNPDRVRSGKSNATHIIFLSFKSMCCSRSIAGFPSRKRSPRSSFLSKEKKTQNKTIFISKTNGNPGKYTRCKTPTGQPSSTKILEKTDH